MVNLRKSQFVTCQCFPLDRLEWYRISTFDVVVTLSRVRLKIKVDVSQFPYLFNRIQHPYLTYNIKISQIHHASDIRNFQLLLRNFWLEVSMDSSHCLSSKGWVGILSPPSNSFINSTTFTLVRHCLDKAAALTKPSKVTNFCSM